MNPNEAVVLTAKVRERTGSRYAQRARQAGGLPAVIYGHKADPVAVTLDGHRARLAIHKGEKVFKLAIEGGEEQFVLLKDLQFDYLGTNIVHADFARVSLDERVVVHVHVAFKGDAPGLKRAGAVLDHPVSELTIECPVFSIPDQVLVDVSSLDIGHPVHARDVVLPLPTMKLLTDGDAVLARIEVKTAEPTAEAATAEAAAPAAGAAKS